jgi:hypothetical protein
MTAIVGIAFVVAGIAARALWGFAVIFLMLLPQLAVLCVTVWHNRSVDKRKLTS